MISTFPIYIFLILLLYCFGKYVKVMQAITRNPTHYVFPILVTPIKMLPALSYLGILQDIRHVAGRDNVVAYTLYHVAISAISGSIHFSALLATQLTDHVNKAACPTAIMGLQLEDIPFGPTNTTLICDVSLGQLHPLVTVSFCYSIFDTHHASATQEYSQSTKW